jgi:hypothetical protein
MFWLVVAILGLLTELCPPLAVVTGPLILLWYLSR